MLLAIDIGNTQTVIGLLDPLSESSRASPADLGLTMTSGLSSATRVVGLAHAWRVATVPGRTGDEHALQMRELIALAGITLEREEGDGRFSSTQIDGIAISSSVPEVTSAAIEMANHWFAAPLLVVGPGTDCGMEIAYDRPSDVGPDRIVDAVAAADLYGAPVIVADLGTATTFDAVSSAKEYMGGAIVPGLAISLEALAKRAAALRKVDLVAPPHAIGGSTIESIQSGAIYGTASLVDGMCERFAQELGGSPQVVATGGLAGIIVAHCRRVSAYEPWLTLHGLRLIFERAMVGR